LLRLQVTEPLEEASLRPSIPELTPIDDSISVQVQQQYEENPYPRWLQAAPTGQALSVNEHLNQIVPRAAFKPLVKTGPVDVLVAGCGTGIQPIEVAQTIRNASVLAIDLSLASIAYAMRKTRDAGLSNIVYAQADILRLGSIGRSFDIIESVGVLHHLADPVSGFKVLTGLLRPGGFMRIGLYSKLAHRDVVAAKEMISELGYGSSPSEIRRMRMALLPMFAAGQFTSLLKLRDFFSTSECRDLLLHTQEHRTTLPALRGTLTELGLNFLGFHLPASVMRDYSMSYPEDRSCADLDLWHDYEQKNPDTFAGMYQFWVQKPT